MLLTLKKALVKSNNDVMFIPYSPLHTNIFTAFSTQQWDSSSFALLNHQNRPESKYIMICASYTLQEKSKEKKVIPGRKEEETKKKKLTVVDTQVHEVYCSLSPLSVCSGWGGGRGHLHARTTPRWQSHMANVPPHENAVP